MQTMSREKALHLLDYALTSKPGSEVEGPQLERWVRNLRLVLETVFGTGSEHFSEIDSLSTRLLQVSYASHRSP